MASRVVVVDDSIMNRARVGIGVILRKARERLGLSQEELADLSGLNRNSLGEIEREEVNPTFGTLWAIAQALGTPLSEIIRTYEGTNPD